MRRLLRNVPLVWWVIALVAASLVGSTTARALRSADAAAARWGDHALVAVVQRPVPAGQPLAGGDVALEPRPLGALPAGAVDLLPLGRVALVDLVAGEVVVGSRLAGADRSGPAALLGADERGVAVTALTGERPPLAIGDRVDLMGVPADGSPARVLARGSRVIDVDDETGAVTVAVPSPDAPAVAIALERGRIVLALTP